ncbi:MAG: glycosyltransferase family 39 protein [Dehalococcoidia bacterium]|nr:glycosyltransferase family 39 protein [Dehalococcoidia bacterium]
MAVLSSQLLTPAQPPPFIGEVCSPSIHTSLSRLNGTIPPLLKISRFSALPLVLVATWSLVLVAVNVIWIANHRAPPTWDEAFNLIDALKLHRLLSAGDWYHFLDQYVNAFHNLEPPLIALLPLPLYALVGPSFLIALLVVTLLIPLVNVFLYLLVRQLGRSRLEAVLSTVILGTMPAVFGLSRQYFDDYPLTLVVIIWLYLLVKSDGYRKRWCNVLLGLFAGLALLLKASFPLFVGVPALAVLATRLRQAPHHIARDISVVVIIGFLVAGTWWAGNLSSALSLALNAAFNADFNDVHWNHSPYSPSAITAALLGLANHGLSAFWALAAVAGLLLILVRPRMTTVHLRPTFLWFLGQWFIPALLVGWILNVNRQPRYVLPALPAVAVFIAAFLSTVTRRRPMQLVPVFVFPFLSYLYLSVATLPVYNFNFGPFVLLAPRLGDTALRPNPTPWPMAQIVDFIERDQWELNRSPAIVVVIADTPYFNPITFAYYAEARASFPVSGLPFGQPERLPEHVPDFLPYLVAKDGGYVGYSYYAPILQGYVSQLRNDRSPYELLKSFPLPDGSRALVYRHL